MTGAVAAGCALGLGSAVVLNWGYAAQHDAASSLPPLAVRRPLRSLRLVFSARRWLLGFSAGIAGWVVYVAALALAPLSIVQAASAAGIGVLALLVHVHGGRLSARERRGVVLAVASLALLGLSLRGGTSGGSGDWRAVAVWIVVSVAFAAAAAAFVQRLLAAGAALGAAAGILYAAGDVATKAATHGHGPALAFVPVLLVCHGLAFVALQLGFQRGGMLATAGVASLLTNTLPIVAGVTVFGDQVPAGLDGALRVAAFVGAVTAAALLARPGDTID